MSNLNVIKPSYSSVLKIMAFIIMCIYDGLFIVRRVNYNCTFNILQFDY